MTESLDTPSGKPRFLAPRTRALLLVIVGLALGVRLYHFLAISQTPFIKFPFVSDQSDMHAFWQWAHAILAGDWLGRDTYRHPLAEWRKQVASIETWNRWWGGKTIYYQAPFYPYFLAALLTVKDSIDWVIAVQLGLGALRPLIFFGLARHLFDDRVALLAAAVAAVYGPFVFYEGVLLRDWLPPLLEPLILLMVVRAKSNGGAARWLLAGAAMAVAALTKESTLAVSGLAALWLVHELRRERRPMLRPLGLLTAAFAVCLFPLVMRNMIVGAPPLAISIQGPTNIIFGLSAGSLPVGYSPVPSMVGFPEGAHGSVLKAVMAALQTHEGNFRGLLHHEFLKVRGLADPFEVPNNLSYAYGLEISPVLTLMINYSLVFPLGVAGFLFLWRRWPQARLLYWYLAAALLIQLITFILSRFRLALVPVLILAAAALVVQVFDAIRAKRLREATGALSVVCALILVQQLWAPFGDLVDAAAATDHYSAALVHFTERRYDRALEEIARFRQTGGIAVESIFPQFATEVARLEGDTHLQWALDLLKQNHAEGARTHVQLAAQAYAAVPGVSDVPFNLGLLYLKLGERDRARSYLKQFLELEPAGSRAQYVERLLKLLHAKTGSEPLDR